jgi:hypothetical protein
VRTFLESVSSEQARELQQQYHHCNKRNHHTIFLHFKVSELIRTSRNRILQNQQNHHEVYQCKDNSSREYMDEVQRCSLLLSSSTDIITRILSTTFWIRLKEGTAKNKKNRGSSCLFVCVCQCMCVLYSTSHGSIVPLKRSALAGLLKKFSICLSVVFCVSAATHPLPDEKPSAP